MKKLGVVADEDLSGTGRQLVDIMNGIPPLDISERSRVGDQPAPGDHFQAAADEFADVMSLRAQAKDHPQWRPLGRGHLDRSCELGGFAEDAGFHVSLRDRGGGTAGCDVTSGDLLKFAEELSGGFPQNAVVLPAYVAAERCQFLRAECAERKLRHVVQGFPGPRGNSRQGDAAAEAAAEVERCFEVA